MLRNPAENLAGVVPTVVVTILDPTQVAFLSFSFFWQVCKIEKHLHRVCGVMGETSRDVCSTLSPVHFYVLFIFIFSFIVSTRDRLFPRMPQSYCVAFRFKFTWWQIYRGPPSICLHIHMSCPYPCAISAREFDRAETRRKTILTCCLRWQLLSATLSGRGPCVWSLGDGKPT